VLCNDIRIFKTGVFYYETGVEMRTGRNLTAGFTLIEVLLAIMLMGIIGMSVYGVFSQGLMVERRLAKSGVGAGEGFWAVHNIARDIEKMRPYTAAGTTVPYFQGSHHRISFVTRDHGRLQRVSYGMSLAPEVTVHQEKVNRERRKIIEIKGSSSTDQERRVCVSRYMELFFDSPNAWTGMGPEEEILTRDAAADGLKFFYLNYDDQGQEVWSREWEQGFWPFAVRVDLTVYDGDQPVRVVRDVFMPLRFFKSRRLYE